MNSEIINIINSNRKTELLTDENGDQYISSSYGYTTYSYNELKTFDITSFVNLDLHNILYSEYIEKQINTNVIYSKNPFYTKHLEILQMISNHNSPYRIYEQDYRDIAFNKFILEYVNCHTHRKTQLQLEFDVKLLNEIYSNLKYTHIFDFVKPYQHMKDLQTRVYKLQRNNMRNIHDSIAESMLSIISDPVLKNNCIIYIQDICLYNHYPTRESNEINCYMAYSDGYPY